MNQYLVQVRPDRPDYRLAVRSVARMNNLRVRRFADAEAVQTIGLVWRKKSSLPPALRKLAATMSQAYPQIQKSNSRAKIINPGTVSAENKKLGI